MIVNLNPQNKNKISLTSFANTTIMQFNQIPMPSLPNHISFSQDCQIRFFPAQKNEIKTQSKPQRKRRKIFQLYHGQTDGRDKVREYQRSQQNIQRQEKVLRKVKSNVNFDNLPLQQSKIEKRIEQINIILENHHAGRNFHLNNDLSKHNKSQKKEKITKMDEKLYETTQSIKNQEVIINNKIPTFQKKIQDNNKAIDSMSHLIKQKIEQDNHNIENLMQIMNKSEDILKSKEQQLGRINSELLLKETELMRNKQISKKRELQLIRMKRIEDLQNQNLQLYQQLERSHAICKFQDFVDQERQEQVKTSGLQIEQQSTIKHKESGLNASVSANNTIGEILSPLSLALNEQHQI